MCGVIVSPLNVFLSSLSSKIYCVVESAVYKPLLSFIGSVKGKGLEICPLSTIDFCFND